MLQWYISLDPDKMLAKVKLKYSKNEVIQLPFKYQICDICFGDPQIPCDECANVRLIPVPDDENLPTGLLLKYDLLVQQLVDDFMEQENVHAD
jgi:hypothetical protein